MLQGFKNTAESPKHLQNLISSKLLRHSLSLRLNSKQQHFSVVTPAD